MKTYYEAVVTGTTSMEIPALWESALSYSTSKKDITIEAVSEVIGAVTGEAPAAWMVSSIVEGGTDIHRGIWIHYERIEIHRNNGFVMTEWNATTWGYQ